MGVADESGDLLQPGIAPDVYLVLRVAVGADQLVGASTEGQVADLGAGVPLAE